MCDQQHGEKARNGQTGHTMVEVRQHRQTACTHYHSSLNSQVESYCRSTERDFGLSFLLELELINVPCLESDR